jgi:hypothetical protein
MMKSMMAIADARDFPNAIVDGDGETQHGFTALRVAQNSVFADISSDCHCEHFVIPLLMMAPAPQGWLFRC